MSKRSNASRFNPKTTSYLNVPSYQPLRFKHFRNSNKKKKEAASNFNTVRPLSSSSKGKGFVLCDKLSKCVSALQTGSILQPNG
jgi:hypothetical protein